jgi:hypothetical protein
MWKSGKSYVTGKVLAGAISTSLVASEISMCIPHIHIFISDLVL